MKDTTRPRVELSAEDTAKLAFRAADASLPVLQRACFWLTREFQYYCESPIEIMLGIALAMEFGLGNSSLQIIKDGSLPDGELPNHRDGPSMMLIPQAKWQDYRIDFALKCFDLLIFIECDGHDFHERTPEQAERDRSRDRASQAAGIPVLRFTGREIYRDAGACADEVAMQIANMLRRP